MLLLMGIVPLHPLLMLLQSQRIQRQRGKRLDAADILGVLLRHCDGKVRHVGVVVVLRRDHVRSRSGRHYRLQAVIGMGIVDGLELVDGGRQRGGAHGLGQAIVPGAVERRLVVVGWRDDRVHDRLLVLVRRCVVLWRSREAYMS